ncbi:MAG: HIT domain-containing protein [Candidatus Sungbacteria bacterium]|uniref:HIT domain-containing protein n=1 Tax=Candidatus Sungiibacteriota bacterium TaxID=2750080 RepID=A0A932R1B8_9BACT|nr:HIT domain-containing protein [Candidatus Sungbacteria bacterium]
MYKNIIEKIGQDGVCPFCPAYLKRYHKKPIIKTGRYWILTDNMYPYKGAAHHLLLIHKKHIEHFSEITPGAWQELQRLVNFAVKRRAVKGAAFVMRFGDTSYTGASVSHLHANIIGGAGKNRAPIMFRVG